MKNLKDAEAVTPAQLMKLTEPEVDEYFEAVWEERYIRQELLFRTWGDVYRAVGAKERFGGGWTMSFGEVKDKADELADRDPKSRAAVALESVRQVTATINELDAGVLAKLDAEFDRRGEWTRAYLAVTNGKGHIHKSMRCSTCNKGERPTRFHWMIEWSGKTEDEIIEAAGSDACTVCYKNAPVARGQKAPERTMFARFEIEREQARAERTEAKAKRDAAKEAKAIHDINGGPLKVWTWTKKAHQRLVRDKLVDVPEQEFFDTLKTLHEARGWLTSQFDSWYGNDGHHRDLDKVADAVGLKEGKHRSVVLDEAKKRAARRR